MEVSLEFIFFAVLAGGVVCATVGTISAGSPVTSALWLVLNFLALAGIYLLLNAPFIAAVQVIVYAGAIMVLFLFTIMLLDLKALPKRKFKLRHGVAVLLAVTVLAQMFFLTKGSFSDIKSTTVQDISDIKLIGKELTTNYLLPFEAASMLLLVAIIGAVIITKRVSSLKS